MPNPYVNKVIYGTTVLVDLTEDTVTPSALAEGYTAHDKSGAAIVGTATGGSMVIRDEQDSHGGTIRSITAGSVVTGTKAITANGTYDVAAYADASVNVPTSIPTFSATVDEQTGEITSITCDKTYAECQALIEGGNEFAHMVFTESGYSVSCCGFADVTRLQYCVVESGSELIGFIHYYNGHIEVEQATSE